MERGFTVDIILILALMIWQGMTTYHCNLWLPPEIW